MVSSEHMPLSNSVIRASYETREANFRIHAVALFAFFHAACLLIIFQKKRASFNSSNCRNRHLMHSVQAGNYTGVIICYDIWCRLSPPPSLSLTAERSQHQHESLVTKSGLFAMFNIEFNDVYSLKVYMSRCSKPKRDSSIGRGPFDAPDGAANEREIGPMFRFSRNI